MTNLPHALWYASRGLRVLPLVPGKKYPANRGGCSVATTDEAAIRDWWRQWPKAGIGLVPAPRCWVLDVDSKPPTVDERKARGRELIDGHEALERLAGMGYDLPVTLTAKTPNGGLHYWFKGGEGMRPCKYAVMRGALAGLDVRAEASYVVAPPTVIEAGEYVWIQRTTLQVAPPWLLALVARKDHAPRAETKPLPDGYEQDRRKRRWAEVVLDNACNRIATCGTGRHDTWFREAILVGGILWGVDGEQARARLEAAAQGTVTGRHREISRTIDQGLAAGSARPVYPEDRG